ncbi:MAG TPA: hypothetical protein VFO67_00715 [Gemmatimonadales bacterium]|nr:hypothetical protein [Gemmatimonadales bacterium]
MPRVRFVLAIAVLVAASACGGGGAQPGGTTPVDRESLRPEEWGTRNFYSAYDAIAALRPAWLNLRGPEGQVQVYVDDNHLGGVEVLRTIRPSSIAVMKHLDGIQASARYGLNHDQGAILVSTRATRRN